MIKETLKKLVSISGSNKKSLSKLDSGELSDDDDTETEN